MAGCERSAWDTDTGIAGIRAKFNAFTGFSVLCLFHLIHWCTTGLIAESNWNHNFEPGCALWRIGTTLAMVWGSVNMFDFLNWLANSFSNRRKMLLVCHDFETCVSPGGPFFRLSIVKKLSRAHHRPWRTESDRNPWNCLIRWACKNDSHFFLTLKFVVGGSGEIPKVWVLLLFVLSVFFVLLLNLFPSNEGRPSVCCVVVFYH